MTTRTVHPALVHRCLSAWIEEQVRGTSWRRDDELATLPTPHPPALPCDGASLREVSEHGPAWPAHLAPH